MGNRVYHIAALIIGLHFLSCNKIEQDCTEKGDFATIVRQTGPFHSIQAEDRIDVLLHFDPSKLGTIELSGPGNLFSGLRTEVKGDLLMLQDKNRCKWLRSLKDRIRCDVYVDSLQYLYSMDDASFSCEDTLFADHITMIHKSTHDQNLNIQVRAFWLQHWQAGQVNVKGACEVLEIINYETGEYSGAELDCNDAFIYQYGLNAIHIRAEKRLTCKMENTGDVYYHVKPVDTLIVSGKGPGEVLYYK
ncbi:MAG: hypothetical protein GC180_06335 [Bacteroidetes bacterium]|nr:hypothetical protein [Bacteroidota bacterium]